MREIKTVIQPIEHATAFDALVNCLLIDGWTLTKREIKSLPGPLSDSYNAPTVFVLYGELERNVPPFPEEITI